MSGQVDTFQPRMLWGTKLSHRENTMTDGSSVYGASLAPMLSLLNTSSCRVGRVSSSGNFDGMV